MICKKPRDAAVAPAEIQDGIGAFRGQCAELPDQVICQEPGIDRGMPVILAEIPGVKILQKRIAGLRIDIANVTLPAGHDADLGRFLNVPDAPSLFRTAKRTFPESFIHLVRQGNNLPVFILVNDYFHGSQK